MYNRDNNISIVCTYIQIMEYMQICMILDKRTIFCCHKLIYMKLLKNSGLREPDGQLSKQDLCRLSQVNCVILTFCLSNNVILIN